MSRHEGVSCDSCMKGNFTGKRYKCLVCYDYDLCASCYESNAFSSRHSPDHAVQCILTHNDFELYFGGESVTSDQHQSYTCPHCGRVGFTDLLLLEHVSAEHADASSEVVCPVCAAYPGGEPNHVIDDLAAHLMLEHRSSNNDLDMQLSGSGMRGVRRIPHHGRSAANPRTRRAANLHQYQSPGGGLMALSPGDRDRDVMDPIADLLTQLSSVRSRTAAAQSISSQLQQLEMQLHSTRHAASRLQSERTSTTQLTDSNSSSRSTATIVFPPATEQSTGVALGATSGKKDQSAFLLSQLDDRPASELDKEQIETDAADKSIFIQELLLAALTLHANDTESPATKEPAIVKAVGQQLVPDYQPAAASPVADTEVAWTTAAVERTTTAATASVPRSTRASVTSAPSVAPVDSRNNVTNTTSTSRNVTKRKPLPANTRMGKESNSSGNAVNKRH